MKSMKEMKPKKALNCMEKRQEKIRSGGSWNIN